ncbi:MAG: hypothetical protein ACRBI6_09175 [Acidimicrobiales bacterium]
MAEQWVETGSPRVPLDPEGDVPREFEIALLPRDASIVDGDLVPKDFAYPMIAAAVAAAIGDTAVALAGLVSACLATVAVGWLTWELVRSKLAAAGSCLLAQTSVAWWAASFGGFGFALSGIAFGVASIAVLVRFRGRRAPLPSVLGDPFVLAGLLGGLACGFHYGSTPWWGGLLAGAALGNERSIRAASLTASKVAGAAAVALVPVLVFNAFVYGSPTDTGYSTFGTVLTAIDWQGGSVGFSWVALERNISVYLLRPEVVPVVVILCWAPQALRARGLLPAGRQLVVVAIGAVALVAATGSSTLWGTDSFETNASFLRYLAPVFAVAFALCGVVLSHLRDRAAALPAAEFASLQRWIEPIGRWSVAGVWMLVVVLNAHTVWWGSNGQNQTSQSVAGLGDTQLAYLREVPEDAFVVSRRLDKVLYPERRILVAAYLNTTTERSDEPIHLYDTFPSVERVAAVADALADQGFFIVNDTQWLTPDEVSLLASMLSDGGRCLEDVADLVMYEVVSCPDEETP